MYHGARPMGLQPSNGPLYDEQLGISFTQSSPSLTYNVTAVEQTDPSSGDGPAYLLNGLSSAGYWYQVGVAWNWDPGSLYGTGFAMVYEVFDSGGTSVLPAGGGGGLLPFSGPVQAGDSVTLRLFFSGGTVVMYAEDAVTGATAQTIYGAQGATEFSGQVAGPANANGFFTGLMTEWYHPNPYYADEQKVTYATRNATSGAWMWIDEFQCSDSNCTTETSLFFSSTNGPVTYDSPTRLVPFTSNGATEFSTPYVFVTGSLSSRKVSLTVDYTVEGGGLHPEPVLSYYSDGVLTKGSISGPGGTFFVDLGSVWNVTALLPGSGAGERWITLEETGGTASANATVSFVYYHQYFVTFQAAVAGGGSGFIQPGVSYTEFGAAESTATGSGVWADAGTNGTFPASVGGPAVGERWAALSPGVPVGLPGTLTETYEHQYYVAATSAPRTGGSTTPTGWYGAGSLVTFDAAAAPGWRFEGWTGSGLGSYSGNSTGATLALEGPLNETAAFYPGFKIVVSGSGSASYTYPGAAGVVSSGSTTLYVPLGTPVYLSARPSSFLFEFEGWTGTLNGSQPGGSATVSGPSEAEASFGPVLALLAAVFGLAAVGGGLGAGLLGRRMRRPTHGGGEEPGHAAGTGRPFGSPILLLVSSVTFLLNHLTQA